MKGIIEIKVPEYLTRKLNELKDSPLREKKQVIDLMIYTIKVILEKLEYQENEDYLSNLSDEEIIYVNKKMRRLFYKCPDKIFSIGAPFFINENNLIVDHISKEDIDRDIIVILEYINSIYSDLKSPLDLYQTGDVNYREEELTKGWNIYSNFLLTEIGYIRCDHDEEHENGDLHPLDHLDIFYSSSSTFKVGLKARLDIDAFIDILNVESNCMYLG